MHAVAQYDRTMKRLTSQETLSEVLSRRLIECRRDELARGIKQAEREFEEGNCRVVAPVDIMNEMVLADLVET